jgi:hypothetical protein
MDEAIQEIDIPSVYEYLMTIARDDEAYVDTATRIAEFRPIYPDDPEWESMVLDHDETVFDFLNDGLKVIGIVQGDRCIGYCGYRMLSSQQIVVQGDKVDLPYEMFLAIDSEIDIGADLIYSAQMFIASQENLKLIRLATCC